jgi:hypothetical protein
MIKTNVTIQCDNEQAWLLVRGAALALGWSGCGPTLHQDWGNRSYRIYPSSPKELSSSQTSSYLNDGSSQIILNATTQFDVILQVLATQTLPPGFEPLTVEIRLNSRYKAIVSKDGITVGCQKFPLTVIDQLTKAQAELQD